MRHSYQTYQKPTRHFTPNPQSLTSHQRARHLPATVFILSGDKRIRQALGQRSQALGAQWAPYATAEAFLAAFDPSHPACVLLDRRVPKMGGLMVQQQLRDLDSPWPLLFVSETATLAEAVQAMQAGAVDFILQPLACLDWLEARLEACLTQAETYHKERKQAAEIATRLERLTPREYQVLEGVKAGKLNKQMAFERRISLKTVEVHRARLMEKLQVRNSAELVGLMVTFEGWLGKWG